MNADHRDANLQAVFYHALFFPLLELVGAIAVSLIVWYGGRQVMWTGITLGHARRVHPVHAALLPPDHRPQRQVQRCSSRRWRRRERIFGCSTPRSTPRRTRAPRPRSTAWTATAPRRSRGAGRIDPARRSRVRRCVVRIPTASTGCCRGRLVARRAGRERSRSSAPLDRARPRSSSLLMRFYDPQRGEIRDRRPVARGPGTAVRCGGAIGIVLRTCSCSRARSRATSGSARAASSREALERASREVHADEFIQRLPGGYDAAVVERGATLSAGTTPAARRSRARCARDPRILVLDEATSSVDTHTESADSGRAAPV